MSRHALRLVLALAVSVAVAACDDASSGSAAADAPADALSDTVADVAEPDGAHSDGAAADTSTDAASPMADASPDAAPDATSGEVGDQEIPAGGYVLDVGEVTFQDVGFSQVYEFEAPSEAVSLTFVLVGEAGTMYTVQQLRAPNGKEWVPFGWYLTEQSGICRDCVIRVTFEEQTTSALVPNTPSIGYLPGIYQVRFFALDVKTFEPSSAPARLRVIVKTSSPPPAPGRLDLHLHFTGAGGYTADSVADNLQFYWAMVDLETRLLTGGVALGEVTMDDVPPQLGIIESSSGKGNDLSQLFAYSKVLGGRGLHVYFVDELLYSGPFSSQGLVLGIAGGIPGPATIPGTERSGIAILANRFYLAQLGGIIGTTIAHESGHFLGLFHSTESDGGHDALTDTNEHDPGNLMYWTSSAQGTSLTGGQGLVMQRNPLVRRPTNAEAAAGPKYAKP